MNNRSAGLGKTSNCNSYDSQDSRQDFIERVAVEDAGKTAKELLPPRRPGQPNITQFNPKLSQLNVIL